MNYYLVMPNYKHVEGELLISHATALYYKVNPYGHATNQYLSVAMAHLEVQRETRCITWIYLQCAELTVGLVQYGDECWLLLFAPLFLTPIQVHK